MNEKEISEINTMIAKFMGYHYVPISEDINIIPGWWKLGVNPVQCCIVHRNYLGVNLKYHQGWEWLMLICEKIEQLGYIITITSDCDNTEISIQESGYQWLTHSFVEDINKKRGVYKACAIFIKQYLEKTLKQATK